MIWSTPLNATAEISRSRSGEIKPHAVHLAQQRGVHARHGPRGHLAAGGDVGACSTSARLPNSAVGDTALGPSLKNGASSGIAARNSALPSASSSRASLPSSDSGTPK